MNDESQKAPDSSFCIHHSPLVSPISSGVNSAGLGWAGLAAIVGDRPASLAASLRVLVSVVALGRDMQLWRDYAARRQVCQTGYADGSCQSARTMAAGSEPRHRRTCRWSAPLTGHTAACNVWMYGCHLAKGLRKWPGCGRTQLFLPGSACDVKHTWRQRTKRLIAAIPPSYGKMPSVVMAAPPNEQTTAQTNEHTTEQEHLCTYPPPTSNTSPSWPSWR